MEIGIGLYVEGSREAAETYMQAFGLELGYHVLNVDGTFFHSELLKDGKAFLSVVESEKAAKGPVELGVTFSSRDELEGAYRILSEGGTVSMPLGELPWSPLAAVVTDRFGVTWFLTLPQHRPPEGFVP